MLGLHQIFIVFRLLLLYIYQSDVIMNNVSEYDIFLVGWTFYHHKIHLFAPCNVVALIPFLFAINITFLYVSTSLV